MPRPRKHPSLRFFDIDLFQYFQNLRMSFRGFYFFLCKAVNRYGFEWLSHYIEV